MVVKTPTIAVIAVRIMDAAPNRDVSICLSDITTAHGHIKFALALVLIQNSGFLQTTLAPAFSNGPYFFAQIHLILIMRHHRLVLLLIFGLLIMTPLRTASAEAPFLVVLPSSADGTRFAPTAISGDGSPPAQGAGAAFYAASWTYAKGLIKLFMPAPNQVLKELKVSGDGRVFAGYLDISIRVNLPKGVVGGVQVPFLWTKENGVQALAPFSAKQELISFFGENEAGDRLVFGLVPGNQGKESLPVPGLTWSQKTGYQPVLAPPGIRFAVRHDG
jgi:hypothetical protein